MHCPFPVFYFVLLGVGFGVPSFAHNDHLAQSESALTDVTSGATVNMIRYNYFFAFITFTSASKQWTEGSSFGNIPEGIRPTDTLRATGNMYGSNVGVQVRIATDGTVKYDSSTSVTGRISFTAMYPIAH